MPTVDFRFPGVLNSKEMLVAEAIQARAWEVLNRDGTLAGDEGSKALLGKIVVRLMSNGSASIGDLATAAVREFSGSAARRGQLTPPAPASP